LIVRLYARLPYACLTQPLGFTTLLIASYYYIYMHVFGTNTSAGINLAFQPFGLYGLVTHSLERGVRSDRQVF